MVRVAALALVALGAVGCKPDFGTPASLVTERRILAVKAEPPEVRPGMTASFTGLVVSPDGTEASPAIDWALCTTPKPLDENNVVAAACLDDGLTAVASATPTTMATVPADVCALFGPNPPPQLPGQPPLRPRDPDVTGGYYQPLRARSGEVTAFALERVICDLAQAGADLAVQYAMSYQANGNPSLLPLSATVNGAPVALDALPAGQPIDFTVGWPDGAAESFPVFDLTTTSLVTHRESLRVSWFASGGSFAHEVTGRDENDVATTTDDVWTAPAAAGPVHLWIVLRDSRGGVDFAAYELTVVP